MHKPISKKIASTVFCLFIALMASSCAGTVARPTAQENRDQSGQYDGQWLVEVAKGRSLQNYSNWQFTCGDMSTEFDILVKDSTITLTSGDDTVETYVSAKGLFKMYLPIEGSAKASQLSDLSINNGDRQVVLRGTLGGEKQVGFFTVGIADFGYAGCTSKTTFTRK